MTGAAGLIGAHIVHALVGAGHEVRCLVRRTSRRGPLDGLPVTWFVADLLHADQELDTACAECDVVFHTAALFAYGVVKPTLLHGTAVAGTEALLRACARQGVRRAVVTSSSVVFGHRTDAASIDETAILIRGDGEPPYVAAKIAQHQRSVKLGENLKLDVRFACPTMTVGPTSARLGPSNGMIVAYLADPFRSTYPGGCNIVSARDVAAGHLLIAARGTAGESYLLGSENLAWQQIHGMIAELTGVAPPRVELNHASAFLAATAEEIRAAMSGCPALSTREQAAMVGRRYWYSHAKAAALGYAPSPARDALIETISWLAASPHITREVRARMHLSADIYRFRATTTGTPS
ncbi:MAG TPA: NAD-dependent epimerase/dehydratase family protein [Acetobacteraceae bacterium]